MTATDRLVVTADEAGTRLDQFITSRRPDLSRSQVQRLIREGRVTAADEKVKSGLTMYGGLVVTVDVPPPLPATPEAEDLPLTVLYEDNDLAIINKPAGMVVHPAAGHARGTLVNALLHHLTGLSGVGGTERPGIVHRLDRGTSGVMVVAKHDRAHRALARQFHDREVRKEYLALVWGRPKVGTVYDTPIGRDPNDRKRMSGRARRGRSAWTEVVDIERFKGVSLVRLSIGTGRTHQIRVHLSEAGHPLAGDALYGGAKKRLPTHLASLARIEHPLLHAARLCFTHPITAATIDVAAPMPEELTRILNSLRASAQEK